MRTSGPRRRWARILAGFGLVVVALEVFDVALAAWWRRIPVGHETTRITGPLLAQGGVDYVAALDAQAAAGVTAENNAAPLLLQALGNAALKPETANQLCARLGMAVPGPGVVSWEEWAKEHGVPTGALPDDQGRPVGSAPREPETQEHRPPTEDLAMRLATRPWTKREYPDPARWLVENEGALAALHAAVKRERLYVPVVGPTADMLVMDVMLPGLGRCKALAHALSARAMLHAGEGEWDEAEGDLMAAHRLARLVVQGPSLIDFLVGVAIESLVCEAERNLAGSELLPAARARALAAQVAALPELPAMAVKVDHDERYFALDWIQRLPWAKEGAPGREAIGIVPIHFAKAMRIANELHDEMVSAMREPTFTRRRAALAEVYRHVERLRGGSRFLPTPEVLASVVIPSLERAFDRCEAGVQERRVAVAALAIAAYKAEHGAYPETLEALVPAGLLKAVPEDLFTGKATIYQRTAAGCVVYSVGANQVDEGGHMPVKRRTGKDDDIAARFGDAVE